MVSRSVTLTAATPLQRQQIAASEGRSDDTDGGGSWKQPFPPQKHLQRRTGGGSSVDDPTVGGSLSVLRGV